MYEPEFFSLDHEKEITACQIVLLLDFQSNMFLAMKNNNPPLLCMSTVQTSIEQFRQLAYVTIYMYMLVKSNNDKIQCIQTIN